jgi:hypothetical protein
LIAARNPRQEAQALFPDGYDARVLEPSPPAVNGGEYYADDPAVPGPVKKEGVRIVTPTTAGDVTWDELATRMPSLAEYASEHRLGKWKRLRALPAEYGDTVAALHHLAFYTIAPARHAANGKVGLRYTYRGFGTPFFGNDVQVRVEGDRLVVQEADAARDSPITTIRAANEFIGIPYREIWGPKWHDPPAPVNPDLDLTVTEGSVVIASDILGFAFSVLEQLRFDRLTREPSRVQLWPEHFDAAIEIGSQDKGQRASYGVSVGSALNADPYLYVSPWEKTNLADPYWNADFGGATLPHNELLAANDH